MARPENTTLERVQYWQGQTLRSEDFTNLQRVEAQRRSQLTNPGADITDVAQDNSSSLMSYRCSVGARVSGKYAARFGQRLTRTGQGEQQQPVQFLLSWRGFTRTVRHADDAKAR